MKRKHLFEWNDQPWLPECLRAGMTAYLETAHRVARTHKKVAELLAPLLRIGGPRQIVDCCSGGGGPMIRTRTELADKHDLPATLILSDLYPNQQVASEVRARFPNGEVQYADAPVDVTQLPESLPGVRTLCAAFHHLRPAAARQVLADAAARRQPILLFEVTRNTPLTWLPSIVFLPVVALLLTPLIRPLRLSQLVLTYLIPIYPLLITWDGIVSHLRTYSTDELRELTHGIDARDYRWQIGTVNVAGIPGGAPYLTGQPTS